MSAAVYLARAAWINRRVECIELTGRGTVHRRVSVDFVIPEGLPEVPRVAKRRRLSRWQHERSFLVPISMLAKWPPVMDFSFTGPDDTDAYLTTSEQSRALDFGLVTGMLAGTRALTANIEGEIAGIVGDPTVARTRLSMTIVDLYAALVDSTGALSSTAAEAIDLVTQLASSSTLWLQVSGEPGDRLIAKFAYNDLYDAGRARWKRVLIACSWRERTIWLSLPHAGLHTRYHLDIAVPKTGLEVTRARTFYWPGLPSSAQPQQPAVVQSRMRERHVHIYHGPRSEASHEMFLQLRLAPSRGGFVFGCMVTAILIALLMAVAFGRLPDVATHLDSAVVLLAAVPVVLGYVVVRPGEHVLERAQISGVRILTLLAGGIPIVGSLLLVLSHAGGKASVDSLPDERGIYPIWGGLVIASIYLSAGLIVSWIFAANTKNSDDEARSRGWGLLRRIRGRDRRWTTVAPIGGALAGTGLVAGGVLSFQTYSTLHKLQFAPYLVGHEVHVLLRVAIVSFAMLGAYPFVAGLARVTDDLPGRGTTRVASGAIVASGLVFIWTLLSGLALVAWQTITVLPTTNAGKLGQFSEAVDAVINVSLIPAAILVCLGTVFLVWAHVWKHLRSPMKLSACRRGALAALVVASASAVGLVIARLIAIAGHDAFREPAARTVWVAIGVWMLLAAGAIWRPERQLEP